MAKLGLRYSCKKSEEREKKKKRNLMYSYKTNLGGGSKSR